MIVEREVPSRLGSQCICRRKCERECAQKARRTRPNQRTGQLARLIVGNDGCRRLIAFVIVHRWIGSIFARTMTNDVLLHGRAIDESQPKLSRCADVEHWNPHHRRLGETSANEGDQRRDWRSRSTKSREEESNSIRSPRDDEPAHSDDDA
jgi:hypothetical protein